MFIIMIITGIILNPMNVLLYRFSDLYMSQTLFYGGLLMASNMIWVHEIVHYLDVGHFNLNVFFIGIIMSMFVFILLRKQIAINDEQWLRRMISHHSTALTTSHNIYRKTNNIRIKQLANNIIHTQEREIKLMKSML